MSRLRLSCAQVWDAEPDALARFGGSSNGGFAGQRGRGSAPSAALRRLEDGAPAPLPGMRLVQYQLLALGSCGRPACPMGSSEDSSLG